jgi:predicted aspartyl protease
MGIVLSRFRLVGTKGSASGKAVVDTGTLMSILDRDFAEQIGVERTGRKIDLMTLSGQIVSCEEVLVKELEIEGERLLSEKMAVCELPENVKKMLREKEASENLIVGAVSLELAGYGIDPRTRKLVKVGWLGV